LTSAIILHVSANGEDSLSDRGATGLGGERILSRGQNGQIDLLAKRRKERLKVDRFKTEDHLYLKGSGTR